MTSGAVDTDPLNVLDGRTFITSHNEKVCALAPPLRGRIYHYVLIQLSTAPRGESQGNLGAELPIGRMRGRGQRMGMRIG